MSQMQMALRIHRALLPAAVLTLAHLRVGTACTDEAFWVDRYGMSCKWYAEHDPGCTRFINTGQWSACNKTCRNCAVSPETPDPLDTTCSLTDLCACFKGCSPEVLCPVSDEAQVCKMELLDVESISELALPATPYVELRLPAREEVHGVEVQGDATNYARTFTVKWAGTARDPDSNIDSGRRLPANWEGGHKARVLFPQGPVQAERLRLYPKDIVGQNVTVFSASVVIRRCSLLPPGPGTEEGRCLAMKCKAYCYRKLSCSGCWLDFCEQQRTQPGEVCDVQCNSAHHWHSVLRASMASLVVLIAMLPQLS